MQIKYSISIIKDFLYQNEISIDPEHFLEGYLTNSNDTTKLPGDIILKIIGDAYGASNESIKMISSEFHKKFGVYLGRIHKRQLKKYIDYRFKKDFKIFVNLINQDVVTQFDIKKFCDNLIENSNISLKSKLEIFLENIKKAIKNHDKNRIQDYLLFIYSRLISLNEERKLSLRDLFKNSEHIIKKELSDNDYTILKNYCNNYRKMNRTKTISLFNDEYIKILNKNGGHRQKSAVIYINIDQELSDKFTSKAGFYNYLFNLIRKSYQKTQNHKSLIIHIENIIHKKINIKWELYSYLTIFAEMFLYEREKRIYYKPEEICIDLLEHKYNFKLSENEKKHLAKYYSGKLNRETLDAYSTFKSAEIKEDIDYFKNINTGFTFVDCLILLSKEQYNNSKEIEFIKNNNELLLIFNKHKVEDRKIPCPVCGSLRISGNSYPEVGTKSWECKNPSCSARSKTNRGKRYSERTISMQNATFDFSKENQIPKELIKIWRKDVVEEWNYKELYQMIVKYYSYAGDTITVINAEDKSLFKQQIESQKRIPSLLKYERFLPKSEIDDNLFKSFFKNSELFGQFFYGENVNGKVNQNSLKNFEVNDKIKIIHGDSLRVLQNMEKGSIHNMVTSPPYYNAREYSQWKNLYNYLNEMYKIILEANKALKKGGVFFFNIGDIFDNDNIIVKSKMGEKRIPLGAYIILLFKKAGFEFLDNIVWYKGEPQSNRHKNDGNYTPYYQRPANCYEHIFIFKKKGKIRLNNNHKENILTSNVMKFTPVFKIGKGGANRYGHTAPFPKKIPLLSITCFTNENDSVLDPFSGSGTTPITASLLNRMGIGIETKKEYVELSLNKAKKEDRNKTKQKTFSFEKEPLVFQ